jgi:hypothetical protein
LGGRVAHPAYRTLTAPKAAGVRTGGPGVGTQGGAESTQSTTEDASPRVDSAGNAIAHGGTKSFQIGNGMEKVFYS